MCALRRGRAEVPGGGKYDPGRGNGKLGEHMLCLSVSPSITHVPHTASGYTAKRLALRERLLDCVELRVRVSDAVRLRVTLAVREGLEVTA